MRELTPKLIADVIDETIVRMASIPGAMSGAMMKHPRFKQTFQEVCEDLGFPTAADYGYLRKPQPRWTRILRRHA